jgi:D-amino-acid dehydrogenase
MMPNMLPRVGAGRRANVFYNTGHGHLGWTLSAVTAHQLTLHVAQWEERQSRIRLNMPEPVAP